MRRAAKSVKKPAKKAVAKVAVKRSKKAADPEGLPAEVVSLLFDQLSSEERTEKAWASLSAPPAEDERWEGVQERLIQKPHDAAHEMRRWKFFGK